MNVLIVDDHLLFRQGLRSLLERKDEHTVTGEAGSGREAMELLAKSEALPDIVLMDITMDDVDGIETTKIIKEEYPSLKVIILSMHRGSHYVRSALMAGADGFIVKDDAFDDLNTAFNTVMKNSTYLSPSAMEPVVRGYLQLGEKKKNEEGFSTLTKREKEVFRLLVNGNSRQEIAAKMFISSRTVDQHKRNMKKKLNIKNNLELFTYAKKLEE